MFCYRCGALLKEDAKFCNKCGAPVVPPEAPATPVQQEATAYLDEEKAEGTEYLGEEEATEWLSPDTPWAAPRSSEPAPQTPPMSPAPPVYQAPPAPPAPPAWQNTGPMEPRRGGTQRGVSPVAITAVIIVCLLGIAAIVAAVMLSMGGDEAQASPAPSGQNVDGEINWTYYVGSWQLDDASGVTFTLSQQGNDLSLSLSQSTPYRSIQGTCVSEEGGGQRVSYTDDGQGNTGSILLTPQGEQLSVSASSEDMNGLKYTGTASRTSTSVTVPGGVTGETAAETTPSASPSAALTAGDYLLYRNGQTISYAPQDILTVSGDFHLWPTDAVRITEADLAKLTHTEIQAIRNEIYARYGYSFTDERWQKLFGGLSWYQPDPSYSQPILPELIQDNVDTILAYETAQGWRS